MSTGSYDLNEAYRQTQSQIYGLQETILNSTKNAKSLDGSSSIRKRAVTKELNKKGLGNHEPATKVGSALVLEYVLKNYGSAPTETLGTLYYHPYKVGLLHDKERVKTPFPYDLFELSMPRPFLPAFGYDNVNKLVTIEVQYEDLQDSFKGTDSPRTFNNEIWGCQIYTDDSEPLLVLRHCGLSISDYNGSNRTPANIDNPDNVQGTVPPKGTPFDLQMDIILLPALQSYPEVKQFGITSRSWGIDTSTPHDGLSYGIYAIRIMPRDTSTKNIGSRDQQIDALKW